MPTTPTPAGTLPTPGPADDDPQAAPLVVGADGSGCGRRAVRWAAEEAARRSAPLRIVYATPHLGRRGVAGSPAADLPRARRATAQAYTAARSSWPVVVVPRSRPGGTGSRPHVAVLGLGDREDDGPVAEFAAEEAPRTGRPLLVLHSRPDDGGEWSADSPRWAERWPELRPTHTRLPGPTGGRVLAAACPTPLLAMSAGHAGMLHRPLDGLHRWLLRHCTSPMAFVPPVHRVTGKEPREEIIAVG